MTALEAVLGPFAPRALVEPNAPCEELEGTHDRGFLRFGMKATPHFEKVHTATTLPD
jgi:hypothetical protein